MQSNWKGVYSFGAVGIEFAVSVLLGLYVGHRLDEKFSCEPWLTLLFSALGLAAGARALYRAGVRANAEAEREMREEEERRRKFHDGK